MLRGRRWPNRRMKTRLVWAALLTVTVACGGVTGSKEERDQERLAEMRQATLELVGDATCDDAGQCRSIAFGSKPCGGPWRYLVYCAARTDTALLRQRVEEYNRFEAELNRKYNTVSDCAFVLEPTLDLVGGECVAVGGGGGS